MREVISFDECRRRQKELNRVREYFSVDQITTKHLVVGIDQEELLEHPFYQELILESEIEDYGYKQYSLKITDEVARYYELSKHFTEDVIPETLDLAIQKYGEDSIEDLGLSSEIVAILREKEIETVTDLCHSSLRSLFGTFFYQRGGKRCVREICDRMIEKGLSFYVHYTITIEVTPADLGMENKISYNELTCANILYLIYPEVFRPLKRINRADYKNYLDVINIDHKIVMNKDSIDELRFVNIMDMGLAEQIRMALYPESIFFMQDILFRSFADIISIPGMTTGGAKMLLEQMKNMGACFQG